MDAKLAPFSESASGISGLETLLSLVLKLVEDTTLSLPEAIARVTANPARVLGIEVGQLLPGAPADICVFNPNQTQWVTPDSLHSQGLNCAFFKQHLPGIVNAILVGGRQVL